MISFWTNIDASRGISDYRENRGRAIAKRIRPRSYEEIECNTQISSGPQVFAALDQLSDDQRQAVEAVWDGHSRAFPTTRRLNDPRHVLLRFELLTRLYERGLNQFRVYRAGDVREIQSFPVFVRETSRHNGPLTPLLTSTKDVQTALRALRFRGHRMRDLMIVEFCDASDSDNVYRKYSAFKVGETILPWHLMVSRKWNVKSAWNQLDAQAMEEGFNYVEGNPHKEWLERVFSIARIDFGRLDYGVVDGEPQVWEINVNPSLGGRVGKRRFQSLPADLQALREHGRVVCHERLRSAFLALDHAASDLQAVVQIDPSQLRPFRAVVRRRRRQQLVLRWLHRIHEHRWLGWPMRKMVEQLPRRPTWLAGR